MSTDYDGIYMFGFVVSASVLLKFFRRDFSPVERCHALGLPFPHQLMSHRGGSLEHMENTLPGKASYKLYIIYLDMFEVLLRSCYLSTT